MLVADTLRNMRIAILNSYDMRGGAARAAYRLHSGLRALGQENFMVVQSKSGDDADVLGPGNAVSRKLASLRPAMDLLPVLPYWSRKQGVFYPGWLPGGCLARVAALRPDVVHMHWISGGLLYLPALRKLRVPVAWTLHDMWAFTGGCHYDNECGKHQRLCGSCPVLGSTHSFDLSYRGWKRKESAYRDTPLTFISPSNWLKDVARSSALLAHSTIHVIPNGIDTSIYRPISKSLARERLGLPAKGKLILFGAANAAKDVRKGMEYLEKAIRVVSGAWLGCEIAAAIFGVAPSDAMPELGMKIYYPGILKDEGRLAELYSAADVFVAPSLQENLSNTVMEALSCGTPCVAFDVGGMRDMVEHEGNGYLARPRDADDLAAGIRWVLEDEERVRALCVRAREKVVSQFDAKVIARRHVSLYEEILESVGAKTQTVDA